MKVPPIKRKRKVAGRKIAPLTSMPSMEPLSEAEWHTFLQLLPSRPAPAPLRGQLDLLMTTYLGVLEAEANSPSAREVAAVLKTVAQRAHQFAQNLRRLEIRVGKQGTGAFNTANEAAADILAKASIKPEDRSALDTALRGTEILAVVAAREAKKLTASSKKGRSTRGAATAWLLRQLADLLHDAGLLIRLPPRWGDPLCVSSQHFLRAALIRAKSLRQPESPSEEIHGVLMLSNQVFVGRLRQAAQPRQSSLPNRPPL